MAEYNTVNLEFDGDIAIISINRPEKLNTFNKELRKELLEVVSTIDESDTIRVAILTGVGRAFSAGADLSAISGDDTWSAYDEIQNEYKPILLKINTSDKLFITAVNGAAAGAGSALALIGDLCVMAENAYLLEAFAAISLVPDCGATWHLSRQLGPKIALELMLNGERISAQKCSTLGLANKVVAAEDLLGEAKKLAELMASKAPLALKHTKKLVNAVPEMNLSDAITLEAKIQDILVSTEDAIEGRNAFMEKRKPVFTGK